MPLERQQQQEVVAEPMREEEEGNEDGSRERDQHGEKRRHEAEEISSGIKK